MASWDLPEISEGPSSTCVTSWSLSFPQEEAKTFITPENLDARIEECLDNPRNYNFAIDKEGRIVKRTMLS